MNKYQISDFTESEVKKAKEFVETAIWGIMELQITQKVDDWFRKFNKMPIDIDEQYALRVSIEITGRDLLTALGVAKRVESRGKNE